MTEPDLYLQSEIDSFRREFTEPPPPQYSPTQHPSTAIELLDPVRWMALELPTIFSSTARWRRFRERIAHSPSWMAHPNRERLVAMADRILAWRAEVPIASQWWDRDKPAP